MEVLVIFAVVIAATLAFVFFRKHRTQVLRTSFADGTKQPVTDLMNPANWFIGPMVWGENRSVGVARQPTACDGQGFFFDFPFSDTFPPARHVHSMTLNHGPLAGKTEIVLKGHIAKADGTRMLAKTVDGAPGLVTLFFQRKGDDWTMKGEMEAYRWYATFATLQDPNGDFEIRAPLAANWTAAGDSTKLNNRAAFDAAVANTQAVGVVFGGGDGFAHGAYTTAGARFIVRSFEVN